MASREHDLLLDQPEIVEEPFGGERDAPPSGRSLSHELVRGNQHTLVVGQSAEQSIRSPPQIRRMPACQDRCVATELIDAEELAAEEIGLWFELNDHGRTNPTMARFAFTAGSYRCVVS
jgi:hypothetical protein